MISPSRFPRTVRRTGIALFFCTAILFYFTNIPPFTNQVSAVAPQVMNLNDSGTGSLRAAIAAAASGDTITFGVTGTIALASELAIDKDLIIQGPGAEQLIVSGNTLVRVFNIGSANPAINVTFSGLGITKGKNRGTDGISGGSRVGGGIYNNSTGTVRISDCKLTENAVIGGNGSSIGGNGFGGGIYNANLGTLTITDSTITNNSATGGSSGGPFSGGLSIGGGIYNTNGTVNIINSTIASNSVIGGIGGSSQSGGYGFGGGIYNSTGTVNITGSTIIYNSATGGSGGFGGPAIGGGINNDGTVVIINSTIANNTVLGGTFTNIAGFGGSGIGSGVINAGTLTITNSTVANNSAAGPNGSSGGGILITFPTGPVIIKSSIIAKNSANSGPDIYGPFSLVSSQGFNLIGNNSSAVIAATASDQIGTASAPIDPLLGPLAANGGPTLTMSLLTGSPAIDKGMNTGLTTDQRRLPRIVDVPSIPNASDGTDIGAFEFNPPKLTVRVAGNPNEVGLNDPAVCIDPSGLVGVEVTLTNSNTDPNIPPQQSSLTIVLPGGMTAVAGTCIADVNPAGCSIAANGSSINWSGILMSNQTVTVIYRARLNANIGNGSQLCLDNTGIVGGAGTNLRYCFTVNCPLTNSHVSDQKAGSVLVFPYYTSTIGGSSDTRLTITNSSNADTTVANTSFAHLFFIDGTTCQQNDLFLCLTPNASISFKASEYDPSNTGYLIAVAVNRQGLPVNNNVLIGNAFVNTPQFADNYSAESFRAYAFDTALYTISGNTATLYFDQVGYDAIPKQFTVEIQSPQDAAGQQIITSGLRGDLTTAQMSGATQVGSGLAFNEKESFVSFNGWLTGACQVRATISTNSPRVPNGLGNLIKAGQAGSLKFNVGAAVGLLLTPRTAPWRGIRALHKTQTVATTLTIPIFAPVC